MALAVVLVEDVAKAMPTLHWSRTLVGALLYALIAGALAFSPSSLWRYRSGREAASVAVDVIGITALLLATDEAGAYLAWLYIVVSVRGAAEGSRDARYFGLALSLLGFGVLLLYSNFWAQHRTAGFAVVAATAFAFRDLEAVVQRLLLSVRTSDAANAEKRRYLSHISHQIRNPLNVVVSTIHDLANTPLTAVQKPLLAVLHQASAMLLDLVNDVLDISKIEAGKLDIACARFDLHVVVGELCALYENVAAQRGVRLWCDVRPECPYALLGDERHLRQILSNLIDNALKFTDEGAVGVRVALVAPIAEEVSLRFEVQDTGIGISLEEQARIFDAFAQASSSIGSQYGGTGLGTSICKQLVEGMGGRMGLESALGEGSVFWFEIPFRAVSRLGTARERAALTGARVLLVGYTGAALSSLTELIEQWGGRCDDAATMGAAVPQIHSARAQHAPYTGVVLHDTAGPARIQLAAERLGARAERQRCPVIVTTATIKPGQRAAYLGYGIADLHVGTVDEERLLNALHFPVAAGGDDKFIRGAAAGIVFEGVVGVRVLVAEDDPLNRETLVHYLSAVGYSVSLVENGMQVLDFLETHAVDVMILDLNMPGLGGLEAYKLYVSRLAGARRAETIILSADATEESRAECTAVGIGEYLQKPLSREALLAAVNKAARRATAATLNGAAASASGPAPASTEAPRADAA